MSLSFYNGRGGAEDFFEHTNHVEPQVHEQVCHVPVLFLDYGTQDVKDGLIDFAFREFFNGVNFALN